jgi:hypothetical protein
MLLVRISARGAVVPSIVRGEGAPVHDHLQVGHERFVLSGLESRATLTCKTNLASSAAVFPVNTDGANSDVKDDLSGT